MDRNKEQKPISYDKLYNEYTRLQEQLQTCEEFPDLSELKENYEHLKQKTDLSRLTPKQGKRITLVQAAIDELINQKDPELSEQSKSSEPEYVSFFSQLGHLVSAFVGGRVDPTQVEEDDDFSNEPPKIEHQKQESSERVDGEETGTLQEPIGEKDGVEQLAEVEDDVLLELSRTVLQDEEIRPQQSVKFGSSVDALEQTLFMKSHAQLTQKHKSVEFISSQQGQISLVRTHSFPNQPLQLDAHNAHKFEVEFQKRADTEQPIEEQELVAAQDEILRKSVSAELQKRVDDEQLVEEDELRELSRTTQDKEIRHERSDKLDSPVGQLKQHLFMKHHFQLPQKTRSVELISVEQEQSSPVKVRSLTNLHFQFDAQKIHKSEKVTKEKSVDEDHSVALIRQQHLQKVIGQLKIIRAKHNEFEDKYTDYTLRGKLDDAQKYRNAADAAKNIHSSIVGLTQKYIQDGDLESFKSESKTALQADNLNVKTLQEHRGLKLILTNLAALIFTVGLAHVGYSIYNGRFSIFEPATDSSEKVEALRESVNTLTA